MKINNIILVLRTRIILLSSFVIYFFCMCHSGRFPIVSFSDKAAGSCPPMMCMIECEFGFQTDEDGCDKCACNGKGSSSPCYLL